MSASQDFLMTFQRALKACQLYGPVHPRNAQAMKSLLESGDQLLRGKTQLQIAARNGRLFVDKVMEDSQNLQVKSLAGTLEEREIHALVIHPGAALTDWQALLNLLCQKPGQLRTQGGAKKLLEDQGVMRIRILAVRLQDVSEAGEIATALLESMGGLAGTGSGQGGLGSGGSGSRPATKLWDAHLSEPSPAAPAGAAPAGVPGARTERAGDVPTLVGQMRDYLVATILGGQFPPDLSGLGPFLQRAGMDQQGVQPSTQGVVRQAVTALEPEHQVDLFLGAAQLRPGPLRNLFGRLSSTLSAQSLARTFSRGSQSPEQIAEVALEIQSLNPNSRQWGEQLVDALRQGGMSEGQLRDLVDILNWESQPVEQKLEKLLQGQRIFEMPAEKVLAFMRELLEAGRNQEFVRLLRHYSTGLFMPAVSRRVAVARGFATIADWVDIPGMPTGLMNELMELLSRAYGREKDPEAHQWIAKAVEHILWFWVDAGDPKMALALFTDLQDVVTELSLPAPWKSQATAELLARLGAPERVNKVLDQLFLLDRQGAALKIHPYLRMLGSSAANHLVERLSEEPDRSRRARLLEALKSCGQVAEAPLLESLKSPEWFVVRNALIVLAEIAGPERIPDIQSFLVHPDARVVGAAIRAIGRLGGRTAENALIPLIGHRDPGLQMEALFTLSEMKTKQAVPALIELARGGKGRLRPEQERVREKAVEVLGQLGSTSAIPALQELLARHRGFFRESREPLAIRLLALKALLSLDAPEAQDVIDRILKEEPKGPERDALQAAVTESLA